MKNDFKPLSWSELPSASIWYPQKPQEWLICAPCCLQTNKISHTYVKAAYKFAVFGKCLEKGEMYDEQQINFVH